MWSTCWNSEIASECLFRDGNWRSTRWITQRQFIYKDSFIQSRSCSHILFIIIQILLKFQECQFRKTIIKSPSEKWQRHGLLREHEITNVNEIKRAIHYYKQSFVHELPTTKSKIRTLNNSYNNIMTLLNYKFQQINFKESEMGRQFCCLPDRRRTWTFPSRQISMHWPESNLKQENLRGLSVVDIQM